MSEPPQRELLELALNHRNHIIKLKAAWTAAKCGYDLGVQLLVKAAQDGSTSQEACRYLTELGRADAIPAEINEPTFQAMATMAEWLADPSEFDRPPDEIALYDTRELYWPPTGDRRQLWLFKFRYIWNEEEWEAYNESKDEMTPEVLHQMACEKPGEQAGLGMVGSVTFGLFGEVKPDTPLEHAYALHCCWELRANNDPRAPEKRSVEAGLKLLREFNQI
jgi:hypothetical protein